MTKQRLSTADRMSGPAAILAFVACFAVVLSPSFFATLVMVASERPWGFGSKAEPTPAAIFPVMQERSEEVRTGAANLPPPPAPDETGRELLQLIALRSTVRPHTEPAATHPEDPAPVSNPVEPIGVAAPVLAPAAPERDVQQRRHVVERLGFLSVPPTGFPGALQSFREAHPLDAHAAWDDHPALAAPGRRYATSLRKLASGQCRWVLSTPPDKTMYCGAPTNDGSWCAWHRRIVYAEPDAEYKANGRAEYFLSARGRPAGSPGASGRCRSCTELQAPAPVRGRHVPERGPTPTTRH